MHIPKKIIISRTDSIGDVILALPVGGALRELFPQVELIFLGSEYTREIVHTCKHFNHFISIESLHKLEENKRIAELKSLRADCIIHTFPRRDLAKLARQAEIPLRIGASGRWYNYKYCNKIVPLTRRRSVLHEAQLNLKLLRPLGSKSLYSLDEIQSLFGFDYINSHSKGNTSLLKADKFNLILHPKSKGSAREWGLDNFRRLIELLPKDRFEIFVTGTASEGDLIKSKMPAFFDGINNMTGKFTVRELIGFIQAADGLIAASTGPLHIAAISSKIAIGLYPPIRPMHPGRWAPLGEKATTLVKDKECSDCRGLNQCECLTSITPKEVQQKLLHMIDD